MLAVNLKGYFLCARAAFPHLQAGGHGRIVNLASITAFIGMTHLLDYVSSKGGVISFTRALAREVGPDGVTVNAISPGAFPTDAEKIHPNPGVHAVDPRPAEPQAPRHARRHRQSRGLPVGDASSFVTGQVIEIDGGWYMH